jgi:predicted acetyltransferase
MVTLVPARQSPHSGRWLRDAHTHYIEELVVFDPEMYHRDEHGQWQPDYLPYWLEQPFCHPFLICDGSTPAGFAFVGAAPFPYMTAGRDFRLCEFYVIPEARRRDFGRSAVNALFAAHPGAWELFVLRDNAPAQKFWTTVLEAEAGELTLVPDEHGTLMSFRVATR